MSSIVIAIPARHASTRLPGKPLLPLAGKPMLAHVIARAKAFSGARIVLATEHPGIAAVAREADVEVVMTRADHPTGSDRLAEMCALLQLAPDAIVVNLQGDEPQMPLSALQSVVHALQADPEAAIATLATPIVSAEELFDPNCVKVVLGQNLRALYFSRAPMPYARDAFARDRTQLPAGPFLRHLGLYAYRASALQALAKLPQSPLELIESLEQLRALEAGMPIAVRMALEAIPAGVDSEDDLRRVESDLVLGEIKSRSAGGMRISARRLMFVCMGNICRSPLSWAMANKLARDRGWSSLLKLESAGTHAYHRNAPADLRSQMSARALGLDLSQHRARLLDDTDWLNFDLILAHDERNLADIKAQAPAAVHPRIRLLMDFAPDAGYREVPDPYSGDHSDFILAAQLIKQGVEGLFKAIEPR